MGGKYSARAMSRVAVVVVLLMSLSRPIQAAAVVDELGVDLSPLIDASARYPTRFAVDIGHPVSAATQGHWTDNGTTSTWTYTARINTAVSMSFHASRLSLPPSAQLRVSNARLSVTYRARDISRGGLWARPLAGDAISLSMSVSDRERAQVQLDIDSFQAGYRGLGGAVPDHPHYRQLMAAAATGAGCTENFSCDASPANQGPAHATVAILIGNVGQCTATLLNDTKADGAAYVLTARHCETGVLGGGDPGAAASITVYWDAVTPCGATLGSIYDGSAITQTGATTLVEQQDAWLIQLDAPPAASDAYFAGWDATGGTFSGGYSIHHALGYNKQYVGWYGQPILQTIPGATLQIHYASTFWGVVNQIGNVGAGASGGALFDPDNQLVGSATLAELVNGANTAGVCPANPVPIPTPATISAEYTSLASVWSSTADTTSTTSPATLQSVLDSAKTGNLTVAGAGSLPVMLSSTTSGGADIATGALLTLTWSAPGAQSCTASGGLGGDGWAGARAASGTYQLTEQAGGSVIYSMSCTGNGQIGAAAAATVSWVFVPVVVNLNGPAGSVPAGGDFQLQWSATGAPCVASGGVAGDGWAGSKPTSGSMSIAASTLGNFTYTLSCGAGARLGTGQATVTVVAPSISPMTSDANQLRVGQTVNLQWDAGGACVASGGGSGDGWTGTVFMSQNGAQGFSSAVTETVAGTYTYTVTCTGAGSSFNSSITLTFTGSAPAATLTPTSTSVEIYTDPGAYTSGVVNLNWTTNVRPCAIAYTGPGNVHGQLNALTGTFPGSSAQDSEAVAGAYLYTLTCGVGQNQTQATATVNWYTNNPAVTLLIDNPFPQGSGGAINWDSNVYPCTGTGGSNGDGWVGSKPGPLGSQVVTESAQGSVTFGITCGSGAQIVSTQTQTTVVAATVTISASATTLPINQAVSIRWTANFEPCTSLISPPGNQGWGTVLPMTGGYQATELVPGVYTYSINCAGAQASTQVTFTGTAPMASLTANTSSSPVNAPVTLRWTSLIGSTCVGSGGTPGDGWSGTSGTWTGSALVTSAAAATVTYSITCAYPQGQGQSQAQTQVIYMPVSASAADAPIPGVTLSASAASQTVGNRVTLSWTSQNASDCEASGGDASDGWTGSLALSGSMSVTESAAGSFKYAITCTGAPPAATAQAQVTFSTAAGSGGDDSGSGSHSSGGGSMDPSLLAMLCGLVLRRLSVAGRPAKSRRPVTYS